MKVFFTAEAQRAQRKMAFLCVLCAAAVKASPVWKTPPTLPFGQLSVLELREDDPGAAPIPRPAVEDTLGDLKLRALEPSADGHGWKFTVQAMRPGLAVVPPLDLGDGRRAPELRVSVLRTTAFGSPWVGYGGGKQDNLPEIPFPWAWASLLLAPLLALIGFLAWRWRRRAGARAYTQARKAFLAAWPPKAKDRASLDAAHGAGRSLLASAFGEASLGWGAPDFKGARLDAWAQWTASLDAARFGRTEPPFPDAAALLTPVDLEMKARSGKGGRS
ncbi:MAG: hypothetical protein JST05_05060 [Acidobacteria bacterium]|nr:hypothetical protein [Acidobacteriota bacterium]